MAFALNDVWNDADAFLVKMPLDHSAEIEFHDSSSPIDKKHHLPLTSFVRIEIPEDLMPNKITKHQPREIPRKPLGKFYDHAPLSAPARTGFKNRHVDIDSETANAVKTLREQKWRFKAACAYRRSLTARDRASRCFLARGVERLSKKLAKRGEDGIKLVTEMEVLAAMPDPDLKKKWSDRTIENLCKRFRDEFTMRRYGKDCFVDPEKPEAPPAEDEE